MLEAHKVPCHYLTHFSPDHKGNKEAKLSVAKPMVTSKKQRQSSSSALPLSKDMSLFTRAHSEHHQKPAEQSHAHCCKKATPLNLASCCWSVTETPSKDMFQRHHPKTCSVSVWYELTIPSIPGLILVGVKDREVTRCHLCAEEYAH